MQAGAARRAPTVGEALGGLAAFLLLVAVTAGIAAALVWFGERPALPARLPTWSDVAQALMATEPPLEAARYVASMAGWAVLTYVAAVLLLRALASTAVGLARGAAWARDLERLVDLVTVPWVKRGMSGGLMAALLVASLVKVSPELPRLSLGGGGGAGAAPQHVEAHVVQAAPAGATVEAHMVQAAPTGMTVVAAFGDPMSAAPSPAGAPQEAQPGAGAAEQGQVAPARRQVELPAPVVGTPSSGGQQQEATAQGDDEAPQDLNVQVPGVRVPGKLQGR